MVLHYLPIYTMLGTLLGRRYINTLVFQSSISYYIQYINT